jgi:hypothetical protein
MTERGNGDRRGRKPRPGTRRAAVDKATGALVLIGGACTPNGEALGSFIRLAGADRGAPLVGFTTASRNPVRNAAAWRRDFESAGVRNVEMPAADSTSAAIRCTSLRH